MSVGIGGESVHNLVPRSGGVGAHDIMTNNGSGYICVYCKSLVEMED